MAKWTKEQQRAIDSRKTNLLLSAGAGAGKTAVLVERLIRRLLDASDPVDVDQILVVTFTNAAATEMRERVAGALHEALRQDPSSERLHRQILLLGRAQITTMHSFCLEILRQNFYQLELDPAFRVADDAECSLLRADILEDLFEEQYQDDDEHFAALVEGFGGRNSDENLQQMVLKLAQYALSQEAPEQWLNDSAQIIERAGAAPVENLPWYQDLVALIQRQLAAALAALEQARTIAEQGPAHYLDTLHNDITPISAITEGVATWDDLRQAVMNLEFGRLPAKRNYHAPDKEECQAYRQKAKDTIKALKGGLLAQSAAEISAGFKRSAPQVAMLCSLTCRFLAAYGEAKRTRAVVDFSDLEHMALAILGKNSGQADVAGELRNRFVEVLVDEYQDINAVQEAILLSVARPDNMVMVGDVKQSIYRFRLAEPNLFRDKERNFSRPDSPDECVYLSRNFRSRSSVITAVNYIFSQLMSEATIGEVDYDHRATLLVGANYPPHHAPMTAAVEVCLFDRQSDDSDEAQLDNATREARLIADEITRLLASDREVWDSRREAYRALRFSDIVVLQRATTNRAELFLEVFKERGIPAFADSSKGYFRATEVHVILSLLRCIDNPRQDIPLAAVLRSPLVGLSADSLVEIRLADTRSFWDALLKRSLEDDRLSLFVRRLELWRDMARRGGLPSLLLDIYRVTGYFLYVGTLPGGKQRQANLRALVDRSYQYEATSYRGLFRFLRFIERLEERDGDLNTPNTCGENDDVVRFMSVHKSKGLEFPVVFLAGLGNKFNLQDVHGDLLRHRTLGLGLKVVDTVARVIYPNLAYLYMQHVLRRESLSEELRVLYVAMTRAREKLYLVGSRRHCDEAVNSWRATEREPSTGRLPANIMENATSYWDWVGPALFGHASLGGEDQSAPEVQLARVWISGPSAIDSDEERATQVLAEFTERQRPAHHALRTEVARRLGYRYPHVASTQLGAKISVSELKRRVYAEDTELTPPPTVITKKQRPSIARDSSALTAAERGTAIHMLLQQVDLNRSIDKDYLLELKQDLIARHLLSAIEAESLPLDLVEAFFATSLGMRLRSATTVYRELPFSLRVPAKEIHPDVHDEWVYVQGVIDCLFLEGERLVLVDYKSDDVSEVSVEEAIRRYRPQLAIYARAAATLFKREVSECYIHFLVLRRAVNCLV